MGAFGGAAVHGGSEPATANGAPLNEGWGVNPDET